MKKILSPIIAVIFLSTAASVVSAPVSSATAQQAKNGVGATFTTAWVYESPEDNFTNDQVTGHKWWQTNLRNNEDDTKAPIKHLSLKLDSALSFDIYNREGLTSSGPPVYEWNYGDIPESVSAGTFIDSSTEAVPVTFTPGFDALRSVDKVEFPEEGTQTVTISLTPRETTEGFHIRVQAEENDMVNPVITSPTSGEGINLSPDGHYINIDELPGLELDKECIVTITIKVSPKLFNLRYMPYVLIGSEETVASGSASGSTISKSVGDPEDGVGTWTWRTDGDYKWYWEQRLGKRVVWRAQNIAERGPVKEEPDGGSRFLYKEEGNHVLVHFLSNWIHTVKGDDFVNKEVKGQMMWRIAQLINVPDETGALVKGVKVTLESELRFDFIDDNPLPSRPGPLTRMGPPVYEWSFGDVPEGPHEQTGMVYDAYAGFNQPTVKASPGYNVSRSFDKTVFTSPGNQTMTVTVIPREEWVKEVNIGVSTWEDDLIDPVFTSILRENGDSGKPIVDPGGRTAEILNIPVELNVPITVIVTSQVTPKMPAVEYKPNLDIHAGRITALGGGTTNGSSFSYTNEAGVWKVSAEGEYVWNWRVSAPSVGIVASKYEVYMNRVSAVPKEETTIEPSASTSAVPKEETTIKTGANTSVAGEEFHIWVLAGIGMAAIAGLAAFLIIRARRKRRVL
jgi:hypothetical protein